MSARVISAAQGEARLDWLALSDALEAGHRLPRAEIRDSFLYRGKDTVLSRAAWIDGLGIAVKTATLFAGNVAAGKPAVNGGMSLYSDLDGTLTALIDFHLVTKWKTAGDSLLAARKLARPDSRRIVIVGAGTQAGGLRAAYGAAFPDARFAIWNRTHARAEALAAGFERTEAVEDLEAAVRSADIVTSATISTEPLIRGDWLQPGQHIDLIGAFRPDMREVDDAAMRRAEIYVDSRDTTLDHIGELKIPLSDGVIARDDVRGDFYDIAQGGFARSGPSAITLFKNGGGAHLDLMTGRHILDICADDG